MTQNKKKRWLVLTAAAAAPLLSQELIPIPEPKPGGASPTMSVASSAIQQVPNRYIIRFVTGTPPSQRVAEARSIGATILHNFTFSSAAVVELHNANALQGLSRSQSVLEITPDVYVDVTAKPPRAPNGPNNLVASVNGNDISLAWNDRASDEDGYIVRRCAGAGCTNLQTYGGPLPANTAAFTDSELADGVYRYDVVAFNANGTSNPSNTAEATVSGGGAPPPPPPPGDPVVRGTRQLLSYGVQRVGRPVAGSTGVGIGVALIDSGVDFQHADLAPSPDAPGTVDPVAQTATGTSFNAAAPGSSCQDVLGHGTHVAGLLGARDNNMGIVGVAPDVTIYCAKLGDANQIPLTNVQAALEWVLIRHDQVTPQIRVVNMSLAAPSSGSATEAAIAGLIQQLYAEGVITVVSAGNDPTAQVDVMFPGNVANVVSVAGTTATDGINTCGAIPGWVLGDTPFSHTTDGPSITISAPASEREDILLGSVSCTGLFYGLLSTSLSTVSDGPGIPAPISRKIPTPQGPVEGRGTSFAAPLVSGVLVRIYEQKALAGTITGTSADANEARATMLNLADRLLEAPLDHPWAGVAVIYSFDGVREGVAQAPMPAP